VRSTAAPYTESRLTRSVANERVGFPVVEQLLSAYYYYYLRNVLLKKIIVVPKRFSTHNTVSCSIKKEKKCNVVAD
jgi:hypothetical protein